ncbi:Uncharacterized protein QTN25_002054 [Entamoeba marina]
MSTRKGNSKQKRSKTSKCASIYKKIKELPNEGLCQKCHDIIEWKKKFHKYKPLKVPGVCLVCRQKTVRYAYHTVCQKCASEKGICAKCREKKEIIVDFTDKKKEEEEKKLFDDQYERMSLRQKKTFWRRVEKNPDIDQNELLNTFTLKDNSDDWSIDLSDEDDVGSENNNESGSDADASDD